MRSFKMVLLVSLLCALPVGLIWLVGFLVPSKPLRFPSGHYAPRFPIASDTTYITDPIDSEGYVDYVEALNRRFSKGVDPHSNRIVALLEALGPKPDRWQIYPPRFYEWLGVPAPAVTGDHLISLKEFLESDATLDAEKRSEILKQFEAICDRSPWQGPDHPQIAAWLERNRVPLEKVISAMQKPQYFHPVVARENSNAAGRVNVMASLLYEVPRELTNLFVSRAMQEIGKKDYQAAKKSILSGVNCLHGFKPLFIIDLLILRGMEVKLYGALHLLLEQAPFSLQELEDLQRVLEAVEPFPPLHDLVNDVWRLAILDEAITINQLGVLKEPFDFGLSRLDGAFSGKKDETIRKMIRVSMIDQEDMLRTINSWLDQAVADLKIADPHLRREALKAAEKRWKEKVVSALDDLHRESQSWLVGSASGKTITQVVGLAMVQAAAFTPRFAQEHLDKAEEKRRLVLTSIALAKHRVKTGQYPETLNALTPNFIRAVPPDLFSGLLPLYVKQGDGGYLLYSVGPDRVDNGGRGEDDIPVADDIAVKCPAPPVK